MLCSIIKNIIFHNRDSVEANVHIGHNNDDDQPELKVFDIAVLAVYPHGQVQVL